VSAERALPWWASDGPVDGGVDRSVDPIERHRAARRGAVDPGDVDAPPWWAGDAPKPAARPDAAPASPDPDPPLPSEPARGASQDPARHRVDACGVCPFCISMRLLQDTRPDLVDHLTEAARHLAAAARSLLDTPVPGAASDAARSGSPAGSARTAGDAPRSRRATADGRLQRIVLDDGPGSLDDPPGDPAGGS
jgi:hypothetical protein